MRLAFGAMLLAYLSCTPARVVGQGLTVVIESPSGGVVEGDSVILTARVSPPEAMDAVVVLNDSSYHAPVVDGVVHQELALAAGVNRVGVVVNHAGQSAGESVTFMGPASGRELMVVATWPSRGEIIDLWVREPGGETCKWDHRQTESGGALLDFSHDAIGFGSQAYVLDRLRPGRFRIKLHYWGAAADDDARELWSYRELLVELAKLDAALADKPADATAQAQRARVLSLIDRWASPAAVQTPVVAEVVLFGGSAAERRFRFDRIVQREGHLLTLGEIDIDAAMLREVRKGQP